MSDHHEAADRFHAHLDICRQCREHPFNLCREGGQLLIATGPVPETWKADFAKAEEKVTAEVMAGFPFGRFMALYAAVKRGHEPRQEDIDAIDAWRDAKLLGAPKPPRISLAQLTAEEIDELLQICVEDASLELDHIETVDDDNPDDDGHGELVSYHPKYRVWLTASCDLSPERLQFVTWDRVSFEYDEWDRHHWEIRLGEIMMPMGLNVAPVRVVKWFLDHGFKLWGDQPAKPEWLQEAERRAAAACAADEDRHFHELADAAADTAEEEEG